MLFPPFKKSNNKKMNKTKEDTRCLVKNGTNWSVRISLNGRTTTKTTGTSDLVEARKVRDRILEEVAMQREPRDYMKRQYGNKYLDGGIAGLMKSWGVRNLDGFRYL